jgi:hypothetical protein
LFSCSDDGQLYLWDLNAEKLIQKYTISDEKAKGLREEQKDLSNEENKYPINNNRRE